MRAGWGRARAVMAVVKADAYGLGACPVAAAARHGGATWLGVAAVDEGVVLRRAGLGGRSWCWARDALGDAERRRRPADHHR